jgi:hypothetical protein
MKTNFTFHKKFKLNWLIAVFTFILILPQSNVNAQGCSLGCNGNIQVSLDADNCEAVITADMLLNGQNTSCPQAASYTVDVLYNNVKIPTSPIVTSYYIGFTLTGKVTAYNSAGVALNSCWGTMTIEDKIKPVIECVSPSDPFLCFQLENYLPTATDNCDGAVDVYLVDEQVTINNCNNGFSDEVLKMVTRTYVAEDASGNVSEECTIDFEVVRIPNISYITRPSNYLLIDNSHLQCDDNYPEDANGHPAPISPAQGGTGFPYINDGGVIIPLFPDVLVDCNVASSYSDIVLPPIGCATKIMRTWRINEWSCSDPQRMFSFVQMIEIFDSEGPVMTKPADMTVSTTLHECSAVFMLPAVDFDDNCSTDDQVSVTVSYPGGFNDENGGLAELPVGEHVVTYTAYDACLNSSQETMMVTVADNTPPVAVCIQNTTIAVTSDGTAWVNASIFDSGSEDECALDRKLVRRMDTDNCGDCHYPIFTGYTYLGERSGHHYYLSTWTATASQAYKHSVALGGYLVSLESSGENNWLKDKVDEIDDEMEYWIGLSDKVAEGYWRWSSGAQFEYSNWDTSNPNNEGDYVIVNDNNRWDDQPADADNKYTYVIEITDVCGWSEYAKFCCSDIAEEQMVGFRVVDKAGNYNECMVNATIQDKLPPVISCPADMQVECDFIYDENNLKDFFGEAVAYDNCNVEMDEDYLIELNQCNIGHIIRTFTATDDGGRTAECSQTIYFVSSNPFNYYDDQIIWPADMVMDGCDDPNSTNYSTDVTGKPEFLEGACDLVGADYDDQVFTFNNSNGDACFKIVRTWEVIDWCQFVTNPGGGVSYPSWYHTQIIKVHNTVAPEIADLETKSVCTFDNECKDGYIELTASATDDCTNALKWSYKIDAYNDGSFDSGLSNFGPGNTAVASGTYPIGNHRIVWTFEDKCGNATSVEQLFNITNCKAPTPYCLNGLAVDLMGIDTDNDGVPDEGMIELWASDFDNGSSHPCGYEVLLSFSQDVNEKNKTFTCEDFGNTDVTIYASIITPEGQLIQSFCNTYVDIQDNNGVCQFKTDGLISGRIATEMDENLASANVSLQGAEIDPETTTNEGLYAFPEMPFGGAYTVMPNKNDDFLNGVTTLDLVLIQRHILNLQNLNSPYKIIAADVNNNGEITASDLVQLRKLILGTIASLDNNTSWRFVDGSYTFINDNDPLGEAFPETYVISQLDADMNVDFVALKVGDVNESAVANDLNRTSNESRNEAKVTLEMNDKTFKANDLVDVSLVSTDNNIINGYQFTISFDPASLRFVEVNENELGFNESNIGTSRIKEGIISVSYNDINGINLENTNLLDLRFEALNTGNLSNALTINSSFVKAEAYNTSDEIMDVELNISSDSPSAGYVLFQNTPNPFSNTTEIKFELPKNDFITLNIYDVQGKVIRTIQGQYKKGLNTISISSEMIGSTGVHYYKLESGSFTATRKMVVLK